MLEDCGAAHGDVIRTQFGDLVAEIVLDCTDGSMEGKAEHSSPEARRRDWYNRKIAYLDHVRTESAAALLVSACDKLHHAAAVVDDLEDPAVGSIIFERYTANHEQTLAYYHSLSTIFNDRASAVARTLGSTVAKLHDLAGVAMRRESQDR